MRRSTTRSSSAAGSRRCPRGRTSRRTRRTPPGPTQDEPRRVALRPKVSALRVLSAFLFYGFAAAVILLTLPVAGLVRAATFPFDRHRMVTSRALRFLGETLVAPPFWRVTVEGRLPDP